MNLFRSEEHIRNWPGFDPAAEQGIIQLADVVKLFSAEYFHKRLSLEYVSRQQEFLGSFVAALMELGRTRPFWSPKVP
jgi:hypothetical protein